MRIYRHFIQDEKLCVYLPDRQARKEYVVATDFTANEYERLMNVGWRKFGVALFRPVCETCRECRPIRISAERFTPERSQRRCAARNADLAVRFETPVVDVARLDLFRRYHESQADRKGWPAGDDSAEHYAASFLHNPVPGLEISIWEADALRAVAITDITPDVVSGVYHYYDPDFRERGLGTFVMLQTIALARQLGKPYAYFGYYVEGCADMTYKSRFKPCEIMDVDGVWRPFSG